jgi:3-oxoacyl-(acyl-carrier-protein) synthase/thioesterase domain-containing protein/acyl carrier protein
MDCSPIAIIGLGCRYPGAASPHELWQNLVDGVESIGDPPPWRAGHFVPGQKGGFLDDIDFFDASFFKINPQIADQMDPQQRLLLQLTWSALEDAGLDPGSLRGSNTAVVVGMGDNEYAKLVDAIEDHLTFPNFLGCHPSIPANRISQSFGFSGFSACIYTACSSALVAVDLACRELWLKRSQLAIAAGVNLIFAPKVSQMLINSGWHSKRGQCRPLDATADGYVRSEGIGVAVLKPLEQALGDGDRIYALIQDCRTRHNGQGNGLTLPCLHSQIDLLRDVYSSPDVDPADLLYVELNAVGARVGDVIELKALAAAVGKQRRGAQPLKVGSLKPNIGHSEAASGMAGLIKTALALHHKQLPPTLNYQACDPSFNLDAIGFSVPTTLEPIHHSNKPVLAGISAFGFGGTNAHILLRESPQQVQPLTSSRSPHVLILSAATHEGLRERCATLLEFLRSNPSLCLTDICWTVNRSRSQLPVRVAITAASFEHLQARLAQSLHSPDSTQPGVLPHVAVPRAVPSQLGFVFTGRCAFSLNALAEIAVHHESVREALNVAQRLFGSCRKDDLPPGIVHIVGEVILHQLWMAWGVEPRVWMAEPMGRAAAAIANAVATADSDLETEFQKLISAPDLPTGSLSECPASPVAIGQEPILIQMGSGQVGTPAELAELDGLASSAAGTAWETLLEAAVRLAERGVPVAWSKVCGSQHGRVVSLPTYPFARERHWLGEPSQPTTRLAGLEGDPGHDIALATPLERKLHAVWAEVLGHSDYGITDNFFLVGGHSLPAARLVARIEQKLGSAIPVEAIFSYPTIREQANRLSEPSAQSPSQSPLHLVSLQPMGSRPPLHVVHGWGGRVGGFIHLARALAPHRPVLGLQASAGANPTERVSVTQLADAYAEEILDSHQSGPIHLLGYSVGGWYAYAVAAALLQRGAPLGVVAILDTNAFTRIHRRLGMGLFAGQVGSRLLPALLGTLRPPRGLRRRRYTVDRLRSLNQTARLYLRMGVPGPNTIKDKLRGIAPPSPDPYVQLLYDGYRPPRLPLRVDLFATHTQLPKVHALWSFYAQGGVRAWPLFDDHHDFLKPELAPQLAQALETALQRAEGGQTALTSR